jgi:hypothetical protein
MKLNVHSIGVILFLILIFIYLFFLNNLVFFEKTENSDRESQKVGYLYSFSEKSKNYFLVSEKMLENLNLKYLDKDSLWDPTTCAGMPTLIEKDNIWVLEFKVGKDQKINKRLIKYNKKDNKKYIINLNNYNIIGEMQLESGDNQGFISFYSSEENGVFKLKVKEDFEKGIISNFNLAKIYKEKVENFTKMIPGVKLENYDDLNLDFLKRENLKYYIIGEFKL